MGGWRVEELVGGVCSRVGIAGAWVGGGVVGWM